MSDDRWQRIKALFEAAVERPAGEREAFLVSATGSDAALRRDVESLLAWDSGDEDIVERFPGAARAMLAGGFSFAAESAQAEAHPMFTPGDRIGSYEIVGLLGVGAMGEVYRSRDTRLSRDVAIKVLPDAFARDAARLARFRREAQLLASLNHPNIGAIYGLEESARAHALVLELVDGPTLADRIAQGPISVESALTIAKQIAEALEAAHEQGIVHRDLKPSNVKVRPDGVVKVLDFGLAKALAVEPVMNAAGDRVVETAATHEGLILGTAAYMSPEQAKGLTVDRRADIWAFGCVLFEMLARRKTFKGETITDLLAAVVKDGPDWDELPADTPPRIRLLLKRCLKKDPRQRLQAIGDARIEIDSVNEGSAVAAITPVRAVRTPTRWLPWVALAALAVISGVREAQHATSTPDNPLAAARFTHFTNWDGAEEGAEISPDGNFVAFLSDRDGEFDLWLSQIGTGKFTNLTRESPALGGSGVIVRKLGFSGDGTHIWFNVSDGKPLMLMPLTGGTPRVFLGEGANTPAFSPDGTRLVYVYKPNRTDPMYIADRTGSDAQQLLPPGTVKNNNPAWSPDDRWIYFVRGAEPQDEIDMNIWRVAPSGGAPEQLTDQHAAVNFVAPIDARTLLYVARDEDWSGPWLWALDVERRIKRRVSSGVDQYMSVAASRDGRRIVATIANPSASLWRVPILDRPADDRAAQPFALPVPTGRAMAPRFGGHALFYLSTRGTADGLWTMKDGTASEVWSNADGALFEPAAVSPDGTRVVIVVRQQGTRRLSLMSADGTNRRTLAGSIQIEGAAGQGAADWSPDGKWIVAGGRDERGPALFKIPVDGGAAPVRLVEGTWVNPVWSPKGDLIVYAGRSVIGQVRLLGARPDGSPVDLPEVMVRPGGYRFLPDGSGIVFLPRIQALDFSMLELATGRSRQLTALGNQGALRTFDITPDGKFIVFDRSHQNSNVVLIELPKQ